MFVSIIEMNVEGLSEKDLVHFQQEVFYNSNTNSIDYQEFFQMYFF